MSLKLIRETRGVPAKRGARVTFVGVDGASHHGSITSADRQYIRVRFDGDREPLLCLPEDLTYHDE